MTSIQIYDCTNNDLFSHAGRKSKLSLILHVRYTNRTRSNNHSEKKVKKCQNKLDAYVQAVHRLHQTEKN